MSSPGFGFPDTKFHERETMHNTRAAADAARRTESTMEEIAEAMRRQLDLAESTRADAERSERFTRIMAWCSLGVAVASLGAAIAAIIVAQ
ncbi:hypothetical protein [Microbacterium sp. 13-71-7]|jgi:ElaB/YqjD/DUF883 family membrane-anchored ribosome-binding protein|uniref:hypothetical protein n=1 Tax=Microbacterium sp. 13-71-7 TaxID=1970399 RepID=UPI000BDC39D3|nr:hypothetical protein [Microbacterium sp. 13-71-7]OZB81478.1 MAG: hypothetical protein B7X32_16695 [Microbacterium sp. 13-71-7]